MNMRATPPLSLDLDYLVQEDRVHGSLYTDQAIFELEMEQVFGANWVYVGHESVIPQPGDFLTAQVGRQPIVVSRDAEGKLHGLFNRCAHRGVLVCREERGNARRFNCPYHGWSYHCDGRSAGIPHRAAYGEEFLASEELGLARIGALESYRGFIFACLRPPKATLVEHLGPMASMVIDNLLDRAPEGDIVVVPDAHRYQYRGNWKMHADNGSDGYHPSFTHVSTLNEHGKQFSRSFGVETGYQLEDPKKPDPGEGKYDGLELHTFEYGHCYTNTLPSQNRRSGQVYERYLAALEKRHGAERMREILALPGISNAFIYPNLFLRVTDNEHIRVLHPVAPGVTQVHTNPLCYKGAPEEMAAGITRYSGVHTSAFAMITTDDLDVFERAQEGLQASQPEWVLLARGLGREWPGPHPGELLAKGTWETAMRRQYAHWKQLMGAKA